VWFTDEGTPPAIGRITPSGQITEFSVGLNSGSWPYAIAPGPDGDLWFTDDGSTPAIGRINPSTGEITEFLTGLQASDGGYPSDGSYLGGIAPAPDGNLWFTDGGCDGNDAPACEIGDIGAGMPPLWQHRRRSQAEGRPVSPSLRGRSLDELRRPAAIHQSVRI